MTNNEALEHAIAVVEYCLKQNKTEQNTEKLLPLKSVIEALQTPIFIPNLRRKYTYDEVVNIIANYRSKVMNNIGDIIEKNGEDE